MEDLLRTTIKKLRDTLEMNDGGYDQGVHSDDLPYVNQLANRFLSVTRHTQGQQVIPCILIRVPVLVDTGVKGSPKSRSKSKVFPYRGSLSPREMRAFIKNARLERDKIFVSEYGCEQYTFDTLRDSGHKIGSKVESVTEGV